MMYLNLHKLQKKSIYEVMPAIQKNILIIGKSGVGKSTLVKFFDDPTHTAISVQEYAQTEKPISFSRLFLQEGNAYTFTFFDTPGLFEVRGEKEKNRATSELLDMIETCLKKSITSLDAVFIVYSSESTFTTADLKSFQILKQFLSDLTPNMALILTKSHKLDNEEQEQQVIEAIKKSPYAKEILETCNNRVYFTGVVDEDEAYWFNPQTSVTMKKLAVQRQQILINAIANKFSTPISLPNDIVKLHTQAIMELKTKILGRETTTSQNNQEEVYVLENTNSQNARWYSWDYWYNT